MSTVNFLSHRNSTNHHICWYRTVHISPYLQREWMIISRNRTTLLYAPTTRTRLPICPFPQICQDDSGRLTWISTYCRRAGEDRGPFARHQRLMVDLVKLASGTNGEGYFTSCSRIHWSLCMACCVPESLESALLLRVALTVHRIVLKSSSNATLTFLAAFHTEWATNSSEWSDTSCLALLFADWLGWSWELATSGQISMAVQLDET